MANQTSIQEDQAPPIVPHPAQAENWPAHCQRYLSAFIRTQSYLRPAVCTFHKLSISFVRKSHMLGPFYIQNLKSFLLCICVFASMSVCLWWLMIGRCGSLLVSPAVRSRSQEQQLLPTISWAVRTNITVFYYLGDKIQLLKKNQNHIMSRKNHPLVWKIQLWKIS